MSVLYEKRNHVGWLTLSRPESRNAWGEDFNEDIARRCDEMASDPEIRVAVLTGDQAGGAFSAGANLKNPRPRAGLEPGVRARRGACRCAAGDGRPRAGGAVDY